MADAVTRAPSEVGEQRGLGASAAGQGPSIAVENLSKTYQTRGGSVEAVRTSSFDVKDGEFVALLGPSGCGKSTVPQICAGLIPYDGGRVVVGGVQAQPGRREVGIM